MGRRPDYNGGGSIEYMKKGKHYDCRHRSEDGDCMNRASKWFGFMCREVRGKCDDYFTFNDDTATASKKKPSKPLVFVQKKGNIIEYGDLVLFHSINKNKDIEFVMNKNDMSISQLVLAAIGKSVGSILYYDGNKLEVKSIKCRRK